MSSTAETALISSRESEITDSEPNASSASSKISSTSPLKTSPSSSSPPSPLENTKTRYFITATAETKHRPEEKLLDNRDGKDPPYTRFGVDRNHQQRLPKVAVTQGRRNSSGRMVTSYEDITSLRLWKAVVAELVGTMLLTLVGCGSCINLRGDTNTTSPVVQIALCFGLTVATIAWSIGHISGGHINPAVTAAMLAARKISLAKAVFYILFQVSFHFTKLQL